MRYAGGDPSRRVIGQRFWMMKISLDSNHPNPYGVDKLDPGFREIAVRFLKSTGALSE